MMAMLSSDATILMEMFPFGHCPERNADVAFCLLEDLTAFCFKTSLRFASRPHCVLLHCVLPQDHCVLLQDHHCVLLQDLVAFCFKTITAFCFKIWLRFASRPSLRFASRFGCVLLQDHHCVLLQHLVAFCLKTILRFDKKLLWQNFILHCVLSRLLHCVLPKGKENRLQILQSINQGPFELGTTRDALGTTPEGGVLLGLERPHTYEDLSENINEYYVRFHKLVNDMRNIRMTMPNIQLNSKFVNNMSPEWDRFVTAVKLNKGLKETNHEQLYAYLKQHEKHAAQDRLIIERITPAMNDQLAFVSTVQPHAQSSHVQSHQYPSSSTNPQSPQYPQFPETSQIDSGYTQTDELLDNLTKQMALLAQSFRATLPQTNNQLRTSSNTRNQATIQDGQVVVQNVQGRQNQNQRYLARGNGTAGNGGAQNRAGNANAGQGKPDKMLLMQAQENGAVLDEVELLFLADECDAFDSDVDDELTAQSIFMANVSSIGSANPQAGPSNASILSK
ncbi:hypothetical protein Tco_1186123, partial [Tanacetum coccineum]